MQTIDYATEDRLRGMLFGLAVGESFAGDHRYTGFDSTTMAFCVADALSCHVPSKESLLDRVVCPSDICEQRPNAPGRIDAADLMWHFEAGCFGEQYSFGFYGKNAHIMSLAVARFFAERDAWSGRDEEGHDEHGALTRFAPVVMRNFGDVAAVAAAARAQCVVTHGAPVALDACEFAARVTHALASGAPLAEAVSSAGDHYHPDVARVASGSYTRKRQDELESTGYIAHTLEIALWALHHTFSPREAIIAATDLGGEACSLGAVVGQLAGALRLRRFAGGPDRVSGD